MSEYLSRPRRHFLGSAILAATAGHFSMLAPALLRIDGVRVPQTAPGSEQAVTTFGSLKQVEAGSLSVGYAEVGPPDGRPVILLHGWPYDIHSYVDAAPLLAAAGYRVIVPFVRGYGTTRFLSDSTPRNAQPAALAADVVALMDALSINSAIVAGCDWGARTACILAALWPERCAGLVSVSGYLISDRGAASNPLRPEAEFKWWYQFYLATERGEAGYAQYRDEFAKLIWKLASPQWAFTDTVFERSAASLHNPDHVAIVVHNYRWRLGLVDGESRYDALEQRLAGLPLITVPTITMEGDANGAPHPSSKDYARKFSARYEHRLLRGGTGHNLPQEAPKEFAQAVMDVAAGDTHALYRPFP